MAKVKVYSNGAIEFYCPGCKETHRINNNPNHHWDFNGDVEKPTLKPSILERSGHYCDWASKDDCWCTYNKEHPDNPAPFTCHICHSFVTDGRIQFLSDCTHDKAGQTLELEDID